MTPEDNKPITSGESISLREYFEVRLSYIEEMLTKINFHIEELLEFKNQMAGKASQQALETAELIFINVTAGALTPAAGDYTIKITR